MSKKNYVKLPYVCPAVTALLYECPVICTGSTPFSGGHRPAEPGGTFEPTPGGGAGSEDFGDTFEEEP